MNQYLKAVNDDKGKQVLGIWYVVVQESDFENLYPTNEALNKGTIFPDLYLPFCGDGGKR